MLIWARTSEGVWRTIEETRCDGILNPASAFSVSMPKICLPGTHSFANNSCRSLDQSSYRSRGKKSLHNPDAMERGESRDKISSVRLAGQLPSLESLSLHEQPIELSRLGMS